jgi:hypothetical protein
VAASLGAQFSVERQPVKRRLGGVKWPPAWELVS